MYWLIQLKMLNGEFNFGYHKEKENAIKQLKEKFDDLCKIYPMQIVESNEDKSSIRFTFFNTDMLKIDCNICYNKCQLDEGIITVIPIWEGKLDSLTNNIIEDDKEWNDYFHMKKE